jgi:hypothetical protein
MTLKGFASECINTEGDHLTGMNPADISLIGAHVQLHFGEVLSNGEQRRGLKRRSNRLPDIDCTVDDGPVYRSVNLRVVQVCLGNFQCRCAL